MIEYDGLVESPGNELRRLLATCRRELPEAEIDGAIARTATRTAVPPAARGSALAAAQDVLERAPENPASLRRMSDLHVQVSRRHLKTTGKLAERLVEARRDDADGKTSLGTFPPHAQRLSTMRTSVKPCSMESEARSY